MSAIDHKSPSLLEPRPSLRRPASSTPPFNSPGQGSSDGPTLPKRRRRNDIKSLLDDDTGTVWASSSQGQAGGEVTTVEPTFVNVIDKGLIEEGEARSLWKIYFDGCQPVLPVFDPRTDTFDSFKTRSPLCFCSILTVGAKVRDGPNPPSVLQEALHQEAITMSKESIFSGIDGLEKVQAMLILAAWSRTSGGAGWLAAGHAIRLAVELGMHRSVPRLAKRMLEKRPVDPDIDNVLIAAARVWCSIYVFEIQICLGTGRPPMIGGHRTVRGVRDAFLGNPLSIASDIRLVESCEIYNILSAYLDKLTLLEEKNQMDQAGDELAEVMRQVDKWYKEWDDVMRDHDELKGSYRASLQAQRGFAHLTVNAALMRNLHTTSDIENVSPEMKKIILRATAAAQECIEICAASPPYREMIRCAITHVFSSYGFAGVFLIRMCSLFPKELDIDHVTSLIRLLLDVLDRYPAGIFIHRLHAFLNNLPASPSAQIPPITPSTFSAVPPYLPYDYPPSFTPPAAEIHFSHHHSALSGEMQQHHPRQPHIHAAPPGAVDLYSPQHGAPHNTISYPAWTTTDLQMTGDVNHVPDFLNVCSKGRE
ncbi:hypothetical protein BD410DRAFT_212347 [Rickenella mellea]|uniref:Xylanolytic transcriptional activator regulatory domain-containing protein n=1 Tax=Rickenella mellea TaxID=50990 RepID=A0A4Y7Q5T1_9AGAM|nr:hypothetical protein BD410DRAFT_212347 [Rickenella mellea]